MDGGFKSIDSTLLPSLSWFDMFGHHVDTFDYDPLMVAIDTQDLTRIAFVFAADNLNHVPLFE